MLKLQLISSSSVTERSSNSSIFIESFIELPSSEVVDDMSSIYLTIASIQLTYMILYRW